MSVIRLLAVGDVAVRRPDLAGMFDGVRDVLQGGDITFGQLETPLTDRGERAPHAKLAMRAPPELAGVLKATGFDVMSCAGNHCLDFGRTGLTDTLEAMAGAGIPVSGAGASLAEARRPAIVTRDGTRVATLAYSSILPAGYAAERDRPGCAPMRAHTHYEMIEHDQPGTPPRIHTKADAGDLAALVADVRDAKAAAEIVAVSIHWGIHLIPAEIAAYQREVAHAAIAAGADIILGHHPHILKAVEIHRGKAIFYSLGNFAIEQPQAFDPEIMKSASFRDLMALNPGFDVESLYVLPPETRHTMIAEAMIEDGRITGVGYRPCRINDNSVPMPLSAGEPAFEAHLAYMREITAHQNLATRYEVQGDRVLVS